MGQDVQAHPLIPAIYLHIPFCLTKCGYCSFFSIPYNRTAFLRYYDLLCHELTQANRLFTLNPDTAYFGGGTPSLLSHSQLRELIALCNPQGDAEITLEINPIQITPAFLDGLRDTGVNRLSLGVQSLQDSNLAFLERKHKAEDMASRIALCREHGFGNISLDLMYGLPDSSVHSIQTELQAYLSLQPEHISTYLLTIDDTCRWGKRPLQLPDEEEAALQYECISDTLTQAGYRHYELSNFALPGRESRHNLHYWQGDDYLGVGAGAAGFVQNQRYQQPEDIEQWGSQVSANGVIFDVEQESLRQQKADFIIMQLRLIDGMPLDAYQRRFGTRWQDDYRKEITPLIEQGWLVLAEGFVKLSRKAWFVSNSVFEVFV